MKRTLINTAVLGSILGASLAHAGGWDRSGQDTSIILKEGNLLEVTSVTVKPSVTGTYIASTGSTGTGSTANGVPSYSMTNLGFRTEVADGVSIALIQDTPFGAEVDWEGAAGVGFGGIKAKINSSATSVLGSYDVENLTIYGGLKNQSFSATAANPLVGGYTVESTTDSSIGYIVGAGIENPEIAMKVALTYSSKVKHDVMVTEAAPLAGVTGPAVSAMTAYTPASINLNFQTGVAEGTLIFGSIRHAKWTQTDVRPDVYAAVTLAATGTAKSLKKFEKDTTSYSLGVARKFTDHWVGTFTYGFEKKLGGDASPLGPTDGYNKMGLAATYTGDQAVVTVGMQKVNMGDTVAVAGLNSASMTGNSSLVTAVKVAYKF